MNNIEYRIAWLTSKVNEIITRQSSLSDEVKQLIAELEDLKASQIPLTTNKGNVPITPHIKQPENASTQENTPQPESGRPDSDTPVSRQHPIFSSEQLKSNGHNSYTESKQSNLKIEKYIGENLANKIGIIITIIGVGIGTKYAFDHRLISPVMRIILGYIFGIGLAGTALTLKSRYKNFSAALLSGSMAIMYFVTFSAYSYYNLMPQAVAFFLMVLFTIITVQIALKYDLQIIAHIGLIGAYAVPIFLSDNSGKVHILFSYMAIINCGILIVGFLRSWKPLYYTSFVLSWLIFFSWFASSYHADHQFGFTLVFLLVFFGIFKVTFLANYLLKRVKRDLGILAAIFINGLIFFGIGYSMFAAHQTAVYYKGLFTLSTGLVFFALDAILRWKQMQEDDLQFVLQATGWFFITIAIPVQFNGYHVTLLWAAEAALLYWIAAYKKNYSYEIIAYPVMLILFFSLIDDWNSTYAKSHILRTQFSIIPFRNPVFLTSIVVSSVFIWINAAKNKIIHEHHSEFYKQLHQFARLMIPAFAVICLYSAFELEIAEYFNQLFMKTLIAESKNPLVFSSGVAYSSNISTMGTLWILNYTIFFATLLTAISGKKLLNKYARNTFLLADVFLLIVFLCPELYTLSVLRENYLHSNTVPYFQIGGFNILVRYISYIFAGLLTWQIYKEFSEDEFWIQNKNIFETGAYIGLIWILTSELINWLDIAASTNIYKLGISILWGICSLLLVIEGIRNCKQHLRILAIILFAITLIKLFMYDTADLAMLPKTVLFVSLGLLLLIISFLYNKYKNQIT